MSRDLGRVISGRTGNYMGRSPEVGVLAVFLKLPVQESWGDVEAEMLGPITLGVGAALK